MKVQPLRNILRSQSIQKILLVSEDKEGDAGELVLFEELAELDTSFFHATTIGGIDDVD